MTDRMGDASRRDQQCAPSDAGSPDQKGPRDKIIDELSSLVFDADIADFEDLLNGKKTLQELREEGAPTQFLEKVRVTRSPSGKIRSVTVKLKDRVAAARQLATILGMFDKKPPQAPQPTEETLVTIVPEGEDLHAWPAYGEPVDWEVVDQGKNYVKRRYVGKDPAGVSAWIRRQNEAHRSRGADAR